MLNSCSFSIKRLKFTIQTYFFASLFSDLVQVMWQPLKFPQIISIPVIFLGTCTSQINLHKNKTKTTEVIPMCARNCTLRNCPFTISAQYLNSFYMKSISNMHFTCQTCRHQLLHSSSIKQLNRSVSTLL